MGYGVKWVEEHLGITRDTLRNYESKGLLPINESRNSNNNYREYSEDDLNKLWAIKHLQGIGFTVKEIKDMFDNPDTDFYEYISSKVKDLEEKREVLEQHIALAQWIQLTGLNPTVEKMGSMRYDDFLNLLLEKWDFRARETMTSVYKGFDAILSSDSLEEMEDDKFEAVINMFGEIMKNQSLSKITVYLEILLKMKDLDYKCETVQITVGLFNQFIVDELPTIGILGKENLMFFFSLILSPESALFSLSTELIGDDEVAFLANALAYYIGYDSFDDYMKYIHEEQNKQQ